MKQLLDLISEGIRLLTNLGTMGLDLGRSAVLSYFRQVRTWTVRLAVAAAVPLLVVVPCLVFKLPLGWLYGTYVVWIVLLGAAELALLTPMYLVWRRFGALFPEVSRDLNEWAGFIKSVVFNGLSLGIFVTLFPIWRAPGAFPVLLLVLACWVTLPLSGVSTFLNRLYPAIRAVQLLLLFAVLVLDMAFPRQMELLGWASGRAVGDVLTSAVEQREITSEWRSVAWFSNAGEPQVWFSGSDAAGYRLWAAPGFDRETGIGLTPVSDTSTRERLLAHLASRERKLEEERALQAGIARQQQDAARALADAEQRRLGDSAKASAQAQAEAARRVESARVARAEAERRARYLAIDKLPSKVDYIVSAATATGRTDDAFEVVFVNHLGSSGKSASADIFTPAFVSGGAFDAFAAGRGGADLRHMPVAAMANRLFLAKITVTSVRRSATVDGLFSASVSVAFTVLASEDGRVLDRFSVAAVGPGTSDSDAVSSALRRVIEQVGQRGY